MTDTGVDHLDFMVTKSNGVKKFYIPKHSQKHVTIDNSLLDLLTFIDNSRKAVHQIYFK